MLPIKTQWVSLGTYLTQRSSARSAGGWDKIERSHFKRKLLFTALDSPFLTVNSKAGWVNTEGTSITATVTVFLLPRRKQDSLTHSIKTSFKTKYHYYLRFGKAEPNVLSRTLIWHILWMINLRGRGSDTPDCIYIRTCRRTESRRTGTQLVPQRLHPRPR